jgi:hypothetical protein
VLIIKKRLCIFILFSLIICIIVISGCGKTSQEVQPQPQMFAIQADKIQSLTKGISTDLWENSKYLNTIYTSRELFLQTKSITNYEITPEMYLNIPQDSDHSALFATGYTTIKRYVMDEIDLSVPLDSIWKTTRSKYPEILEQFYIHKYSFIRVYPYRDLFGSYSPKENLTKLEVFRIAQSRKDLEAKVIWFQPEWDPTFNQMVLNVAIPILDGHDLVGVLGCKVSLKEFLKDSVEKDGQLTGIICRNGTLITANPLLYKNLIMDIPAMNPKQNALGKEDLRKSQNPYMRTLAKNLINSPYTNFVMNVSSKSFYVECRLVPGLNWVIFKMNQR